MTNPRRTSTRIHNAGSNAIELADRLYVAIVNATDATLDPKSLSDRPVAEDAGIRPIGEHSDPTADAALSAIIINERVFELMEANVATLELAVANLIQFCERWAPNEGCRVRCHGGRTVDEWSDPTCTNWTAESSPGTPRGDGLCDACRMRRSRWERRQNEREVA
jgi:hypothetical protein